MRQALRRGDARHLRQVLRKSGVSHDMCSEGSLSRNLLSSAACHVRDPSSVSSVWCPLRCGSLSSVVLLSCALLCCSCCFLSFLWPTGLERNLVHTYLYRVYLISCQRLREASLAYCRVQGEVEKKKKSLQRLMPPTTVPIRGSPSTSTVPIC